MRRYLALPFLLAGTLISAQNIFTVAGIPYTHRDDVDGQQALNAPLNPVYGLLIDKSTGRLIFNDQILTLRMEPDGSLLTLAGSGSSQTRPLQPSASTLASALGVNILRGMAQDKTGALYLADAGAGRVYKVGLDGTVIIFAGGGTQPPGFQSDGGLATAAILPTPRGLVFDSKGNLDIAEVYCNCIHQVTPAGVISTVYALPHAPAGSFTSIEGLAIDSQDNLYFTEWVGSMVFKVAADGSGATAIAGTGTPGFSGDGGPAMAAQLNGPSGVTLDGSGNIYIADTLNHRIRKITPDGTISTIAGSSGTCGFAGDNGPAASAQLCQPAETVLDNSGSLIIADFGNRRVRRVTTDGTINTIAGSGVNDPAFSNQGSTGNGGPEIHASFSLIGGIAFDAAGNLYVSDTMASVIRKIATDGTISTFAGLGLNAYGGDGGPAKNAALVYPGPLYVGPDGSVYVITGDDRVRKITPDGIIHLVAGTGPGSGLNRAQGDGGPAVNATLNEPGGVAADKQGNVYIADTSNARVRKVDTNGIITTVAGPGQQGVDYYNAVAVDPQGHLYVAWTHAPPPSIDATVNRVNADGSLTPVAGSGTPCTNGGGQWTGDGIPATQARLCAVIGMSTGQNGLLNMSEGTYSLVLQLQADGTIQRIAGNTAATSRGDGGPALQASLVGGQGWSPQAATFDPAGNMYVAEPGLNIIREVAAIPYTPIAVPDHLAVSGSKALTQIVAVSANIPEPFPYSVRVSTADGGSWLSANRTTGITGESINVSVSPAGLASGTYKGTVAVVISLAASSPEVDVPVTLTVP